MMKNKMSRREFLQASTLAGVVVAGSTVMLEDVVSVGAKEMNSIRLPGHRSDSGNVALKLLEKRSSSRDFSSKTLPPPVMADLVWAAFGVNRPESGKRTAPSAYNVREIDIYAATNEGLHLYDAERNALKLVMSRDIRALTGRQRYVGQAPVNLIYVADTSKMRMPEEQKAFFSAVHTGFISQNVYLFCAAEGLATVVRSDVDRYTLAKAMGLAPSQRIILAQSVGYPKRGVI